MAHLPEWSKLSADPRAMRYLGGPRSQSQSWAHMTCVAGSWALMGFGIFSVSDAATGEWIGRFGPWRTPEMPVGELMGVLKRERQWNGVAEEGTRAVRDWVFGYLGWTEVVGYIHRRNLPARRIARRLGMVETQNISLPARINGDEYLVFVLSRAMWMKNIST
jgi:RimJ/RimL family protein N-acetyltransferase